jgi:6-phosphogluconolactonase
MSEIVIGRRDELGVDFVARFERLAAAAIAARGRFSLAIAGGSAADVLLPPLATAAVDWPLVDVFWCDERAVPPADPESNYGAACRLLFAHPPALAAVLRRMPADAVDLAAAAADYEAQLHAALGDPPQIDLILIGAGPDGHVCSLFPGHAALGERERSIVAVFDSPKPPPRRLTMTLPVLRAARTVVLAAFGPEKAAAVRELVENDQSALPAAQALRGRGHAVCLFDPSAARLLSRA